MIEKEIIWFGRPATLVCDAKCEKAWGISNRPSVEFDENDPDDSAYLSDGELGVAPEIPGVWEGGHAKPRRPEERLNKWCARECERSQVVEPGEKLDLPSFETRSFNQPWKHREQAKAV